MGRLREAVMSLARSEWGRPLTAWDVSRLDRCLLAFPSAHIPTHPPYALMILTALQAMGPSTEKSVVEYIRTNFQDLPWAHRRYTCHHLKQLCEKGSILCTADKHYMIVGWKPRPVSPSHTIRFNPDEPPDSGAMGLVTSPTNIEDVAEENNKVIGIGNLKRARGTVVSDDEDESEDMGIPDNESHCITSECEIQEGEKESELKYLEHGVCHKEDNVEQHSVRGSDEEAPSKHQPDVLIRDPSIGIAEEAQGLHHKRKSQPKPDDQLAVGECRKEYRTDMMNFGSETNTLNLMAEPGKAKTSRGRKKKNVPENQMSPILICGLSTESQKQDKQIRKSSRKRTKLELSPQVIQPSHLDSPPVSGLSEAHEDEQNISTELNMPLVSVKDNATSKRKKAVVVDLNRRGWNIGVQSLVQASFLHQCASHHGYGPARRSLCNWYCLQCKNEAFCILCLERHRSHPVIKVKQTVYELVLDVKDADNVYLDVSGVETHTVQGSEVVSLSRKERSRRSRKGESKPCLGCERHVYSLFDFCSLRCKDLDVMGASGLSKEARVEYAV